MVAVRIMEPGDVQPIGVANDPGQRLARGEDFGAGIGRELAQFGNVLTSLSNNLLQKRQATEDAIATTRFKIERNQALFKDLDDAKKAAPVGADKFHQGLWDKWERESPQKVAEFKKRYPMSKDAEKRLQLLDLELRANYGSDAVSFENNERVRQLTVDTVKSIDDLAGSAATHGGFADVQKQIDEVLTAAKPLYTPEQEQAVRDSVKKKLADSVKLYGDNVAGTGFAGAEAEAALADMKAKWSALAQEIDGLDIEDSVKTELKRDIGNNWSERYFKQWPGQAEKQSRPPPEKQGSLSVGVSPTYVARVRGNESGNDPNAKNPLSSAMGGGQFIKSTWKEFIRERHPELLVKGEIQKWRANKELSDEAIAWYAEKNTPILQAGGVPVTDGTLYLAHFAGPEGAVGLHKANPEASAESVLGSAVIAANPFLRGMSAGDVVTWANNKMSGAAPSSPQYAASGAPTDGPFKYMTFDTWQGALRDSYPQMRSSIQDQANDALTSYQRNGTYNGPEPTLDDYTAAYGGTDGPDRFKSFENDKAVAKTINTLTTASESDIKQTLTDAEAAIPNGVGSAAAQANLNTLQTAANAVMTARKQPAAYVMQNFDTVQQAWKAYDPSQPATAKSAISLMVETQRSLGIPPDKIEPMLPGAIDAAAIAIDDNNQPATARLDALIGMVMITNDPEQQRAIFDQLVKAGIPDKTEVVIDAYMRGDTGAARRMFDAAMVKPDDIPGKTKRAAGFDDKLSEAMFGDGTTGQAFYALDYRDPRTTAVAQRDFELAKSAATLSMLTGKEQPEAIKQAIHDIQGDVEIVEGQFDTGGRVLGIVPSNIDQTMLKAGMEAVMPQVMAAADALKAQALGSLPADASPEVRRLFDAAHGFESSNLITEGVFRPYGDGWGFYDPYSNAFLPGVDGKALVWTTEELTRASVGGVSGGSGY